MLCQPCLSRDPASVPWNTLAQKMATLKRTRRSAYAPNARTRVARPRNPRMDPGESAGRAAPAGRPVGERLAANEIRSPARASRRGSWPVHYPIEVFSEWRGKAFYLCVRYRSRALPRVGVIADKHGLKSRKTVCRSLPRLAGRCGGQRARKGQGALAQPNHRTINLARHASC